VRGYEPSGVPTSTGERLEFWRKSIEIIADAPFSARARVCIQHELRHSAAVQTSMVGLVTADPHNHRHRRAAGQYPSGEARWGPPCL